MPDDCPTVCHTSGCTRACHYVERHVRRLFRCQLPGELLMKHTLYATKPLDLEGKKIARGDVLATIETDHDLSRVVAGLSNGAATLDKPADPSKPAAPAPTAPKA
jgi:hypothetical protein